MNRKEKDLIRRAEYLIKTKKSILPRRSIGILRKGLKIAKDKNDFSNLIEFVPMFEKKYIRLKAKYEREIQVNTQKRNELIQRLYGLFTKDQLQKKLAKLQKESMKLKLKLDTPRPDERTQRKARIFNHADEVGKKMLLIQDTNKISETNSKSLGDSAIKITKNFSI